MNNKCMSKCVIIAILLSLFATIQVSAGPTFAPGRKLYVIKTEHFDIIFSEASRPTALRLSTMADSVYDEVAGKLESNVPKRIPVVITPDIGSFNGGTNPFPYMHIVLYDTSLDIGWTAFKDNFRGLFLHELTHAVSLQIKAPWADFLSGVFGSWVLPGYLNTPAFMTEGVTVSFESADGITGRANDPLIRSRVRQDILENRFKTPMEASGLYDEYPNGTIYYEYGGLFNAYIQKTYGMGKYAELWKAMGNLVFSLSLDPYEEGFYKAFHDVYGIAFVKAWADFRNSIALQGVVDAPMPIWPGRPDVPASMSGGLASDGSSLYWVDSRSKRAMAMDNTSVEPRALFDADSSVSISDAKPGSLLVSRAIYTPDGRDRTESLVYDLAAKRFLAETSQGDMREAVFFRDGMVGVVSRLHNTDLVFASKAGQKVLLPGSESVMYSSPAVIDEGRVALIVAIDGLRSLGILEVDSGKLSLVRPEGADAGLFAYARQLTASGGKVYFNYDSDDRLYKLGVLDFSGSASGGAAGQLRLETTDYSGGVLSPVAVGGRLFYIGRFSVGDRVCAYPVDAGSIGPRTLGYSFEDFDPAPARDESEALVARAGAAAKVEPYSPLAYANPFNMWLPYIDFSPFDGSATDLSTIFRSFRPMALFYFQDPINTNSVTLTAGYDTAHPFADVTLSWNCAELPVALTTNLGDNLVYGQAGPPERRSSGSLDATLSLPFFPSSSDLLFGLGGSILGRADSQDPEATDGSPYLWDYLGWDGTASAVVGWYGRIPGVAKSASRGVDFLSYHDLALTSLAYKTEAHLVAAYDEVPIRLDLWGAWANAPILNLASTSKVFAGDRRPAYVEFATNHTASSDLLVEGCLDYRLVDQAMHVNLLDLYFNRVLLDVGCRGAYFNEEALASTFARISVDTGVAGGMLAANWRFFVEGYALLYGALEKDDTFNWRAGIQVDTDSGMTLRRPSSRDAGAFSSLEDND
jgi:hypothetical protein